MTTKKTQKPKAVVEKNISQEPVKWIVKHPAGHQYVLGKLERLQMTYGCSKKHMEEMGWVFEPIFAAPTE